ncbi:EAL domain-containing protein [Rhodoferax sp. GW822-FHT02A01]|uniref:EAL domain-containing protein n=1 Tax=Rhodoferax sp. GW822-FHT02A01 TaxID=3141537 RepID=UPI00315DE20A
MSFINQLEAGSDVQRDLSKFIADWNPNPSRNVRILFDANLGFYAHHCGIVLRSVFQPIFSISKSIPTGHEALLRATDGSGLSISPERVFEQTAGLKDTIFLDRICRMLHVVNFSRQAPGDVNLYLNMDGRNLMTINSGQHGRFFGPLLEMCGLPQRALVLEILESRISDHDRLVEAVSAYTNQGFKIAIDDFGARDSNFDRLWMLSPQVVKMDRALIVKADEDSRVRRMLPKLVEIVHDLEAEVIFEGIETEAQQTIARDAGADMVQGFMHARPSAAIFWPAESTLTFGASNDRKVA